MTKVVINRCYGGFGLSDEAVKRYAELKGMTLYPKPFEIDGLEFGSLITYWTVPPSDDRKYGNDTVFTPGDLKRDDPLLVQVVEELGTEAASGDCAKLEIEELAPGTRYRIGEYDGREWIETENGIDWSVA